MKEYTIRATGNAPRAIMAAADRLEKAGLTDVEVIMRPLGSALADRNDAKAVPGSIATPDTVTSPPRCEECGAVQYIGARENHLSSCSMFRP